MRLALGDRCLWKVAWGKQRACQLYTVSDACNTTPSVSVAVDRACQLYTVSHACNATPSVSVAVDQGLSVKHSREEVPCWGWCKHRKRAICITCGGVTVEGFGPGSHCWKVVQPFVHKLRSFRLASLCDGLEECVRGLFAQPGLTGECTRFPCVSACLPLSACSLSLSLLYTAKCVELWMCRREANHNAALGEECAWQAATYLCK